MKTCVFVGNGKFSKSYGELIDSYDHVYRFNRFTTTNSFGELVGTKCTHWIINNALATDGRDLFRNKIEKYQSRYSDLQEVWVLTNSTRKHRELKELKEGYDIFDFKICDAVIDGYKNSTGLLAINFFLEKYDEIHLVGFDFGKSNHYWAKSKGRISPSDVPGNHDWKKEKLYVDELIASGKIKIIENENQGGIMDLNKLKEASKKKHGSQFGETGVMDSIFNQLNITPKYCVEFGSGQIRKNGGTANIRHFYDKYDTECLYFEVKEGKIKQSDREYRHQIKIETITASNVNDIFKKYNVPSQLDVVVIDVDGQDYWIWKNLEYNPNIILIEFNPTLPHDESKVMHYDEDHWSWRKSECLYYGASISALKKLGDEKGYSLVYKTERNLVFVKKDLVDIDIPVEELHPQPMKDFRNKYINEQKWVNV